jgi:transposase
MMFEQLEGRVAEIVLAHPKNVRAIAAARIKHDKIDARVLADLLRANLVPAAYIPTRATRDLRDWMRHRAHLARQRTQLKNLCWPICTSVRNFRLKQDRV